MRQITRLLLTSFVSLSGLFSLAQAEEVDLIYNLSGPYTSASKSAWHGAHIAKKELSEEGQALNLVLYNGQSVDKLNTAIGRMCAQFETNPIIVGLGGSEEVSAAAQPVLDAGKVFISEGSIASDTQNKLGKHFFSASPSIHDRALQLVKFSQKKFKQPSLVIVYSKNDPDSVARMKAIQRAAQTTAQPTKTVSADNFNQLITTLKAQTEGNQVLLLTTPESNHHMATRLRRRGIRQPIASETTLSHSELQSQRIGSLSQVYFITPSYTSGSFPTRAQFEAQYRSQFGREPSAAAYDGYNAVMLAATAIAKKPGATADELLRTIHELAANPSGKLLTASKNTIEVYESSGKSVVTHSTETLN